MSWVDLENGGIAVGRVREPAGTMMGETAIEEQWRSEDGLLRGLHH